MSSNRLNNNLPPFPLPKANQTTLQQHSLRVTGVRGGGDHLPPGDTLARLLSSGRRNGYLLTVGQGVGFKMETILITQSHRI